METSREKSTDLSEFEGCRDKIVIPFIERRLIPKRGHGMVDTDISWLSEFIAENFRSLLAEKDAEIDRLNKRDGNAKIQLLLGDSGNPFKRKMLNIVDFGYSDNIYIVEDDTPNINNMDIELACEIAKFQFTGIAKHPELVDGELLVDANSIMRLARMLLTRERKIRKEQINKDAAMVRELLFCAGEFTVNLDEAKFIENEIRNQEVA